METVLRAAGVYLVLLLIFRVIGKRALGEITTFDFVLLLIISESTENSMVVEDASFTTFFTITLTLVVMNLGLAKLKQRSKKLDTLMEGEPLIIVRNGQPFKDRMEQERIDEEDVLEAARKWRGLESIDQIKYAVLEKSGDISVIPQNQNISAVLRREIREAVREELGSNHKTGVKGQV
jgi:uncharacterized membrane protein YcaP (DUF421 family)